MTNKLTDHVFIIPGALLVAIVLTLLPMPDWTIWLRPAWVLLVVIYWVMTVPHRVNVGIAWLVGLFMDILNGTLLGEHALAMSVVAYIVIRMHARLRLSPLLQQSVSILLLVLIYQFILYGIQGFIGSLPNSKLYWLSSVTSMILWPWVFSIIQSCRYRFKMN